MGDKSLGGEIAERFVYTKKRKIDRLVRETHALHNGLTV